MRGKRLLIVDDDNEMRSWLHLVLRQLGASIVEAASGSEFLDRLSDGGWFDLIITDVRMPGASGLCVVAGARAVGLLTPVVLISAFGDTELRRNVAQLEHAIFLEKPFELQELVVCATALMAKEGIVGESP